MGRTVKPDSKTLVVEIDDGKSLHKHPPAIPEVDMLVDGFTAAAPVNHR
jgi:hypothetical protein